MQGAEREALQREERRQNAESGADHGSHRLTLIKALSHPQPSVSSVVTLCGIRIAECGLRNPPNAECEATDETRIKHRRLGMGSRRAPPPVLPTVWIGEGERPCETPSFGIRSDPGEVRDSRGCSPSRYPCSFRVPSVAKAPFLISSFFSPNCLPWVRNRALSVVGSRWYGNQRQMRRRDPTAESGRTEFRNSGMGLVELAPRTKSLILCTRESCEMHEMVKRRSRFGASGNSPLQPNLKVN